MITMKKLVFPFFILILFLSSCLEDDYHVRFTDFVNITEYSIPDSAMVDDTVIIEAKAEAYNGCWDNLYFDFQELTDSSYSLAAYGTYESYGDCPEETVSINDVFEIIPNQTGKYIFYITVTPSTGKKDTLVVQ